MKQYNIEKEKGLWTEEFDSFISLLISPTNVYCSLLWIHDILGTRDTEII